MEGGNYLSNRNGFAIVISLRSLLVLERWPAHGMLLSDGFGHESSFSSCLALTSH